MGSAHLDVTDLESPFNYPSSYVTLMWLSRLHGGARRAFPRVGYAKKRKNRLSTAQNWVKGSHDTPRLPDFIVRTDKGFQNM